MADDSVKPSGPTEEIIIRREAPTKVVRGEGGKFKRQQKTMPKTQDVTGVLRNLLNQAEAGPDGVLRKGGISRLRKMFDTMVTIASRTGETPVTDKFGNVVMKPDGVTPYLFIDQKVEAN